MIKNHFKYKTKLIRFKIHILKKAFQLDKLTTFKLQFSVLLQIISLNKFIYENSGTFL